MMDRRERRQSIIATTRREKEEKGKTKVSAANTRKNQILRGIAVQIFCEAVETFDEEELD